MSLEFDTKKVFEAIDSKNSDAFVSFLTEDGSFKFGNNPPAIGRQEVFDYVSGFFGSLDSLKHDILNEWRVDNAILIEGQVTYTRHDKISVTLPFMNTFILKGDKIAEYRIYADVAPLYAQ